VLATAFFLLLTRWSGRSEVVAMSTSSHRYRPGSEAVIGNFATPYPLRVNFDDNATLEEAVRGCHEAVLAHREHGHVAPASALSAWPEWSRYNINYGINTQNPRALDFGTLKVETLDWDTSDPRLMNDLGLFVSQHARGIGGGFSYNAERFSPELAAKAAARLGELIGVIATAPSRRVASMPRGVE
jgi:non-ribosomal peptide synthetase component F